MNSEITHILEQLNDLHYGRPWVGNSFHKMIEGVDEDLVFVRPLEGMHSLAEIYSHLTFWRKQALVKIKSGAGGKTDDSKENWLDLGSLKKEGWDSIISDHDSSLSQYINLLEEKDDSFLEESYYDNDFGGKYPYKFLVYGILHHDVYHLGQLGIVMKFLKKLNN